MATSTSTNAALLRSRLDRHVRYALLMAMALGYAVLFAAGIYEPALLIAVVPALALGYILFYRPQPPLFSLPVWTALTLVLVLGTFVATFLKVLFFLDALDVVLLALPLIKLFTAKSERDYLQLYALAFAQIIYGTIVNDTISFGLVLAAFLMIAMWGLILLSFKTGIGQHSNRPMLERKVETALFRRRSLAFLSLLVPAVVLITFLLFFVIPRPGSALANLSFGMKKRVSGFSDNVSLGDVGEIKLDHSTAMRVIVENPINGRPFYWRGATLDTFDGLNWSARPYKPISLSRNRGTGRFQVGSWAPGRLTKQTFFLEGIEARYLMHDDFFAWADVKAHKLYLHANGSVTLPFRDRFIQQYTVWSYPESALILHEDIIRYNTQVPETLDPRIPELAKRWAGDTTDPTEIAKLIERRLKNDFTYSLKAGLRPAARPLPRFLFETRSGHCEYFATAMVIMLRTLDIPARLVTGFQEGEYNTLEGYFLVRQADAHAWVEAYIGEQWLRFDPTPAAGWETYAQDLLSDFMQVVDLMRFRWQRYIVSYTVRDQIAVLTELDRNVQGGSPIFIKRWIKAHLGEISFGVLVVLLPFAWTYRRGLIGWLWRPGRAQQAASAKLSRRFARLAKASRRYGVRYEAHLTIEEWAARLKAAYPQSAPAIGRWVDLYEPLRYATTPATPDAFIPLDQAEQTLLAALKRERKTKRGSSPKDRTSPKTSLD